MTCANCRRRPKAVCLRWRHMLTGTVTLVEVCEPCADKLCRFPFIERMDCACRRDANWSWWCWACGHGRSGCSASCRRGLHGWCDPAQNAAHREAVKALARPAEGTAIR